MNNPENQVIDVNNDTRSPDDAALSNVNGLNNDQNNQDMFKDWCEEDGDFEVDEVVQQQDETQPEPQQPSQLDVDDDFDFDDGMIDSGQTSSLNNDQTANNVLEVQKQNDEDYVDVIQSLSKNNHDDDALHFDEDLDDMMTEEIGKTNIGNLCAAQNNEVPVQSVLIDQKDVVTLEDEIIKSQSPEKVQKSKQSPQKGKQRKVAKKTKADTDMITPAADSKTPMKNKSDRDDDQSDPLDSENDPKTKSGRKVQRPEFFTPTEFIRGRRKSSFELASESSRKTKRQTGKRQQRSAKTTRKDMNFLQEFENVTSDPINQSTIYVDTEDDNIVCAVCHGGASLKQNQIVLCDKCDAPYHQRCHKPRIDDIVVEDSQTEWICSKCRISPRLSKRIKADKNALKIHEIHEDNEQIQELISIGTVLTREQKVEYLSSLSQDVLVNLLLLAEQIEPNIPLYPANILGRYATTNMSSRDKEMDETNQSIQDAGECLTIDAQTSGLSTAEMSNLSTLDVSPNLNPVNIEKISSQNPEQDIQQELITPESSPPLSGLKEITEHSKDSYLNLYIRAMSEIGNPNGSTAQTMHSWIKGNYNVPENFTTRAKKALHYAVNKGIFVKNSRMTYKFNPDYSFPYNKVTNASITEGAVKNIGVNANNNNLDEQKPTYKELTSGLQGGEEISGTGNQNLSDMKDFNFYPNQDFCFDSMLDANFLGKGDDTYTATTHSQRSSLSNSVNNNAENNNNNNVSITVDQYNQTSSSSDKQPLPTQSQPMSSISKLQVNAQMMINNEQTRTDIRLPPLAPKPTINALPSIMRSNSINYQPSQQQRITNHQNELLASSIGGVIRSGNQLPQQVYDNTKIRTSSSSIPSLQSLPAIDSSLNGNVNKIRAQQLIPLQSSTMHTATTIPTSPQQTWPSSFNPFYMSPHADTQFSTIFDNTFYDPAPQPPQHHHQQHPATTSTTEYNNVVINDLQQQHNDNNSLFHRMGGNQQDLGEWEYRNV